MYNKNFKFIKKNANAKINFGLQILNKRIDGYHNINTLFYPIFLSDNLEFSFADDFYLNEENPIGINYKENLVYKAWEIMNNKFDISGLAVHINKRIPFGAGLGGGSSDAAKTILAINEIYSLNLEIAELTNIALKCGSDVPYFLNSIYPATALSRGEILNYFSIKDRFNLVLINPAINVSTAYAYSELKRNIDDDIPKVNFEEILLNRKKEDFKNYIFNDFENVIFEKYPKIEAIKNMLYENGAYFALMSGSGSSVFGLFEEKVSRKKVQDIFPSYFVYTE